MRHKRQWLLSLICFLATALFSQTATVAKRLGYPADSKLLIIHADDLGVAHSVDSASFDAIEKHGVTSASILVPCPWLTEVAEYAKSHPDADLGLHLDLTSEWKTYRWGPVESKDKVPSLLDSTGTFWSQAAPAAANAKPEEAETEIRAQVERAVASGIHPTHLDSHMGTLFATPALFAAYGKVAHEYHLPFLAVKTPGVNLAGLSEKDVVVDSIIIANPDVPRDHWTEFYLNAIRDLKPGLTEMIVHLGHDDSELQAIMGRDAAFGSAWRQRDYDFVTSPEFKKAIEENHVILVRWRDLEKLVN